MTDNALMTETSISNVLIVGGGPVGLTLACDLARRDVAYRIIDQEARYPRDALLA
jgi:2-polyprenyl-6-methoxyphenol hydroxylase-like FAD-dependent oxidoreductase